MRCSVEADPSEWPLAESYAMAIKRGVGEILGCEDGEKDGILDPEELRSQVQQDTWEFPLDCPPLLCFSRLNEDGVRFIFVYLSFISTLCWMLTRPKSTEENF